MTGAARTFEARFGTPERLIGLGCLAIGIGVLVYLTDRDPSRAALMPPLAALAAGPLFGAVGLWLPSFVHPFSFSLFTAAAQSPRPTPAYWACAMWWAINVAFELGQAPGVSADLAEAASNVLGQTWLANTLSNYLLQGTSDVADLVAATAGALAAAAVLRFMHHREDRHAC